MKKIFYAILCMVGFSTLTSCSDFLETNSPSIVDRDFVFSNTETARAAMIGAYEQWRTAAQNSVFGDGLFYAADVAGSDIERHPEAFANQPGRHYPEGLYQNGSYAGSYGLLTYMKDPGDYATLYNAIGKANAVINAIQSTSNFESMIAAGTPTEISQLYGEAIALRACCYRELIRYFGDVPFQVKSGVAASGLAPRDSVYDVIVEQLKTVEPLMFRTGEVQKNIFSRTAVQALIGRISLDAAGYQTRRADFGAGFYTDGVGTVLTFEKLGASNNNAEYGRRSDWQTLYATAKTYLKACIDNPGAAVLHDTDPRAAEANGRTYNNPYQYFFQQMNDLTYADESIYEYAMTQGNGNDARPYSMGRPSSGAGSNGFPCKSYGQARINPAFYYGVFDPNDKRRDVSICVTGSTGKGDEKLIPFGPGSVSNGGGLSLNKWDENRMASPYVQKQRLSGINGPYIRLAEVYLAYAEVCAATGDEATAKTYLKKIRERSFPAGQANSDAFIASCGSTLKAVIQERAFEFAGEGDRRWTLIRTGLLPEAIRNIKELTKKMLDGLQANGYYTFDNGNTLSNYVWTKLVDAKSLYGYRLTAECPAGQTSDPVLYPGWRGQNDDWNAVAAKAGVPLTNLTAGNNTNLAIKGLFSYIDPDGSEAAGLIADGYKRENWGVTLAANYDEYYKYLFYDYDYQKAPIYLWPFTPNVIATGGFVNGYGFRQE
ncbi:MAG: RagB/SusD family nutrient uptake outer membrane protein [Dysgonamonadaceae bacterium]|nr:RagB/SusD family nutrient uptake outer membrane protein [Dysgonamonadaceae bacterium]